MACDAVDIERSTAYDLRHSDETFAAEWETALERSGDLLELEARRRAESGVRRLKFHNGALIKVQAESPDGMPLTNEDGTPFMVPYVEHEYSDTLMIFLLKGIKPEKYRERSDVRHSGNIDVSTLPNAELLAITEAQGTS